MNKRFESVGYKRLHITPNQQQGLLPVSRSGGKAMASAANNLFSLASQFGKYADEDARYAGAQDGELAAVAGAPQVGISDSGAPANVDHQPLSGKYSGGAMGVIIEEAAKRHGMDPEAMKTVAYLESKFDPNAKNPKSSAGGLFQFINSTAKDYGIKNRYDPVEAADGAVRLAKNNIGFLTKKLGRNLSRGEMYLAHQQGAGGAYSLLKNPNASAVSVVGAEAVRLNGGNASMSAGEFANLWINKAGQQPLQLSQGTNIPVPAQIEAPVFEPSQADGPKISVNSGTFKLSRKNTIYGRAFDAAGKQAYVQMLETEVRSTAAQAYSMYQDDPVKLEQTFTSLAKEQMQEHVQPEFMTAYAKTFQSVTEGYMLRSRENVIAKKKEADLAAFVGRTNELENVQQQQIEALDPTAEDTSIQIAQSQESIAQHYDDAVHTGVMKAPQAEVAKQTSQRNTAVRFYSKQGDLRGAEDLQQMIDELSTDYADGGINGLDAQGWRALKTNLEALKKTKTAEGLAVSRSMRKQGDDMAARIVFGFDVNADDLSKYMLESKASPEGEKEVDETLAKIEMGTAIRDLSIAEARDHLAEYKKDIGRSPSETELRTLAFARSMLQQKQEALAIDPLSYAEQNGLIPETESLANAQSPDEMGAILSDRILHAQTASEHYGVAPKYLKAGEAKALGDAVKADPQNGAAIAGAIVSGAGDSAQQLLKEFGQDAPALLESGAIISMGGSTRAAQDVLAGYSKDAKVKLPTATERSNFDDVVGPAMLGNDQDGDRIRGAADAITRARLTEQGLAKDSDAAVEVHKRALNEAAGATYNNGVQFGGFQEYDPWYFSSGQTVLVPPNVRADKFEDVIGAIRDDDFQNPELAPQNGVSSLGDAKPLATKNGYLFYMGTAKEPHFITNKTGDIFVLGLDDLLPELAVRVPGSVRGQ